MSIPHMSDEEKDIRNGASLYYKIEESLKKYICILVRYNNKSPRSENIEKYLDIIVSKRWKSKRVYDNTYKEDVAAIYIKCRFDSIEILYYIEYLFTESIIYSDFKGFITLHSIPEGSVTVEDKNKIEVHDKQLVEKLKAEVMGRIIKNLPGAIPPLRS